MSNIRRKSILSTLVIYSGILVGMVNTYLFTRNGVFSTVEYGLTTLITTIALLLNSFANFGVPTYIYKFFPFYKAYVPPKKQDMLAWSLLFTLIGLLLVSLLSIPAKGLILQKYQQNSPLLITYYGLLIPFSIGFTLFGLFESYIWNLGKQIAGNFFREVFWRLLVTTLIVLYYLGIINDFDLFIKLFSFTYPIVAICCVWYLIKLNAFHLTFKLSNVTRRLKNKIISMVLFFYSGGLIFNIAMAFDSLLIASVTENGIAKAGIFGLAQTLTALLVAPQKAIISTAIPALSQAWKDKNIGLINRIYKSSSINLLIFSLGLFLLIILNYFDAIHTFNIQKNFELGFHAFLFLGVAKIIDMGTGVNSQIIGTSNFWKFDFFSGMLLMFLMLPLSYFLVKKFDIQGPAIATVISMIVYNTVRIIFIWVKFKLFPFNLRVLLLAIPAVSAYLAAYYLFKNQEGFLSLFLRSICFVAIYAPIVWFLNLSPDIKPVVASIKKRIGIK